MAPKKNRIEVEQELQGESCHDRAPLPSKPGGPGARRRHRQKPKVLIRRVRWQVKVLHKDTAELYTPFLPFVRLVKEITESCPSQVNRWTPEALHWLQDAADFYLNETFDVRLPLEEPAAVEEQVEEHAGGSPEEAEENLTV